jgi:excisionase family DNA binding protein
MSQDQTTTELERMLSMKDVTYILGVSYGVIYGLIREGKLKAVKVTGEPLRKDAVDDTVLGLRFRPTDVREFLLSQTIN